MDFSWTPHRFSGGALALDVANSVILRNDPDARRDRFAVPSQLNAFPAAAQDFCAERALFGDLAPLRPDNESAFLALREAIDAYFRQRTLGNDDRHALADLLAAIADLLKTGQSENALEVATARSALRLIDAERADAIKICSHCGWLFLDRSKNRSRTWCDMAVCGNRVKARRHYRRQKGEDA